MALTTAAAPAEDARDDAVSAGLQINGLPILTLEPELSAYYRENVIGGPGAFVIAARSYEEFAVAIRNKLVTEIAGGIRQLADRAATHPNSPPSVHSPR